MASGEHTPAHRDSRHPSLWSRTPSRNDDWFDEEQLAEMRDYVRPLRRLKLVTSIVGNVAIIVFALADGGRWAIDTFGPSTGWFAQLVVVVAVLMVLQAIVDVGPSAWVALAYDKRHGVSNQTPGQFALDQVKDLIISTVLISVMFGVLYVAIHAFELWWFAGWAMFMGLQLLLAFAYPVLIMPRFNKFVPLPVGELRSRIEEVADLAGVQIEGIYTMDASKRSRRGNAFVAGFGKTKRVVIFDTILDWPVERVAQVVAHEIGHYRLHHILTTVPVAGATTLVALLGVDVIAGSRTVLDWVGAADLGDPAGAPALMGVFVALTMLTQVVTAWFSRYHEREADLEALELLGDPTEFVGMWPEFVAVNKADLEPTWWRRLQASHPEVAERMQFGWDWAEMNSVPATRPPKGRVPDEVIKPSSSSLSQSESDESDDTAGSTVT